VVSTTSQFQRTGVYILQVSDNHQQNFAPYEHLTAENGLTELDLHYFPSRYPNGIPSGYPHQFYSKKVAEQALAAAEKIFSTVQGYFAGEKEILQNQEEKN